eukprot:gene14413-biopygen6193
MRVGIHDMGSTGRSEDITYADRQRGDWTPPVDEVDSTGVAAYAPLLLLSLACEGERIRGPATDLKAQPRQWQKGRGACA